MLEIIFLISGLYMLFVGRISIADFQAQKGLVRFAGLVMLLLLLVDRWVWGMYPVGLSAADAASTANQILLIGFVVVFILLLRAFMIGSSKNVPSDMVTLPEAANFYLISTHDIERMIQIGAIKPKRVGGQRRVSRDAVGNYLKKSGTANNFLPDLPGSSDDRR